ncbi:MAG: glyoxalase [Sandaracinaceae bacterium]|nr:glyoxalase [Sandaracinaceae bacterium]
MNVLFVAGFAPIVRDLPASHRFYLESLQLPLDERAGDYVHTARLAGVKHFGLWPLAEAAESCFGTREWPAEIPVPQATLELEVDDVAAAAAELSARGHRLLHAARTEPWGQTVARLSSPEGLLVGLTHTPWLQP